MDDLAIDYSIVVPVYNSEKTLQELIKRLADLFVKIAKTYEIVLVDDGSRDGSWNLIWNLAQKDNRLKVIRLTRNFGQHSALICGLNYCKGNQIITLDDDLQNPPDEIPKLIDALKDDRFDAAFGVPENKQHGILRILGSRLLNGYMSWIFGIKGGLRISSFRIIRRRMVEEIRRNRTKNPSLDAIIFSLCDYQKIANIAVRHDPRKQGASQYTFKKLVHQAYNNALTYSNLPLRTVTVIGIGSAFASIVLGIYYFYRYLVIGVSVPGWTSIAIITLFLPGLILFSLGIIGEYLLRIMREVNFSRTYVIREKYL